MAISSLKLTYVPLRALIEPILLLLLSSKTPFQLEFITYESIQELRSQGQLTPENGYPFGVFPTLKAVDGNGEEILLAEALAIAQLIEEETGGEYYKSKSSLSRAKEMMLTSACSTIRSHIFMTTGPDWINKPKLERFKEEFFVPDLTRLEFQLKSESFADWFSPDSIQRPLTRAEAYVAFIFDMLLLLCPSISPNSISTTSLSGVYQKAPTERQILDHKVQDAIKDGQFPLCAQVHWNVYHGRDQVKKWWMKGTFEDGMKRELGFCKGKEGSWEYIFEGFRKMER